MNIEIFIQGYYSVLYISHERFLISYGFAYFISRYYSVDRYESDLFPIWKTASDQISALRPDVMLEICEAEASTLAELERQGLCVGCLDGKCLPPQSLVLLVRTLLDSFDSSCAELMAAYAPQEEFFTSTLQTCVEDIKASANIQSVTSCRASRVWESVFATGTLV